jgi:hypothetical protein
MLDADQGARSRADRHAMVSISTRQLYRVFVETAEAADIAKRPGQHTKSGEGPLRSTPSL